VIRRFVTAFVRGFLHGVCLHRGHRFAFRIRQFYPPPRPWEPIATAYCLRCGDVIDTIYAKE
jgi:hypothetical protein